MRGRRKFTRPLGERRFKKLFIIAVEGEKTEPQYFALFGKSIPLIRIHCIKPQKGSAPRHVLAGMKKHLASERVLDMDEAWLVVDKDCWSDEQLMELHTWATEAVNRGLAVSNPKFELWLLLHYESGEGVNTGSECDRKLRRHIEHYAKAVDESQFTPERMRDAIQRARKKDTPPCEDWPRLVGTTVYRLVESILDYRQELE